MNTEQPGVPGSASLKTLVLRAGSHTDSEQE